MPRQTEPNANNALGDLLRSMMPRWQVRSENTQTFPNHPGRHADVLITAPGSSPVVVEGEYEPAPEVEKEAFDRLGLAVQGEPRTIEAAIALRYPIAVEEAYDVREAVAAARFAYCVLHEEGSRFPESGWLNGSASDLADLIRLISRKLRPGGVVALVLPFTAINGASWAKFRELIATQFTDVTIASIAANGYDMSFSSDTGMAECLIIGRKKYEGRSPKVEGRLSPCGASQAVS